MDRRDREAIQVDTVSDNVHWADTLRLGGDNWDTLDMDTTSRETRGSRRHVENTFTTNRFRMNLEYWQILTTIAE